MRRRLKDHPRLPSNERVSRAIGEIGDDPTLQSKLWAKTCELHPDIEPTYKHVEEVRKTMMPRPDDVSKKDYEKVINKTYADVSEGCDTLHKLRESGITFTAEEQGELCERIRLLHDGLDAQLEQISGEAQDRVDDGSGPVTRTTDGEEDEENADSENETED
jgi:hypothetical protein